MYRDWERRQSRIGLLSTIVIPHFVSCVPAFPASCLLSWGQVQWRSAVATLPSLGPKIWGKMFFDREYRHMRRGDMRNDVRFMHITASPGYSSDTILLSIDKHDI
eukprot:5737608-Amphidinium_carterae.1